VSSLEGLREEEMARLPQNMFLRLIAGGKVWEKLRNTIARLQQRTNT